MYSLLMQQPKHVKVTSSSQQMQSCLCRWVMLVFLRLYSSNLKFFSVHLTLYRNINFIWYQVQLEADIKSITNITPELIKKLKHFGCDDKAPT